MIILRWVYFMYMTVLPTYIYVYHMCAWCSRSSEESIRSPGTGDRDGCWELNLDPLEEQQVHLPAEPSLYPQTVEFKKMGWPGGSAGTEAFAAKCDDLRWKEELTPESCPPTVSLALWHVPSPLANKYIINIFKNKNVLAKILRHHRTTLCFLCMASASTAFLYSYARMLCPQFLF